MKTLSKATLAALLITLSPYANANAISESVILSIRSSLQELGINHQQFSNQDIEFLIRSGLELKDFEYNLELLRSNSESKMTCHSTKCHVHPI